MPRGENFADFVGVVTLLGSPVGEVPEEYHRRETSMRIPGSTQNLYVISVFYPSAPSFFKIDRFEVEFGNKIIDHPTTAPVVALVMPACAA